jgi:uncharacterized protein
MNCGLPETALDSIRKVIAGYPSVREAILFGSRALGREHARSDIDIALEGDLNLLDSEGIALELEELPLPFHFDIHIAKNVRHQALRDHIDRVGKSFYRRQPAVTHRGFLAGITTTVPREKDRV